MDTRPLVILDMDGVLVDVRPSYHRTIVETVRHFTGRNVRKEEIGRFKAQPGFNDDWKLTHTWIRELGGRASLPEVTRHFQRLYLGADFGGYIRRERWLVDRRRLRGWAQKAELAIFTGRQRREAMFTLKRFGVAERFGRMVALEDVRRPKPHPEGLLQLVKGRGRERVIYAGDTVDDALAARRAKVDFLAVVMEGAPQRRERVRRMRELGARAVVKTVNEIERWLP